MSKVEIVGPKENLIEVLEVLRSLGVFHPEPELRDTLPLKEAMIKCHALDDTSIREKVWLEKLRLQMLDVLAMLPEVQVREVYLRPAPIIAVLAELVDKHRTFCLGLQDRHTELGAEAARWEQFADFWDALEPLVETIGRESLLDFVGVIIRDADQLPRLEAMIREQTGGEIHLEVTKTANGRQVGLIMTDKEHIEALRSLLETEQLPELETPEELAGLSFTERARALRRRREECRKQLAAVAAERNVFALRWRPIYRAALTWLESRLSVFQASSAAYQTRSCFFILGWVFSSEVPAIRDLLEQRFSGQVVTSERKLLVEDYQLAPVVLKNPPYFEPFELLTSLLPLPRYSSYDPTPFIGLFFPLLFGMTLGDVGYGLILILVSLGLIYGCSQRKALVAAGKILGICAVYTVLFGLLFGELFGDLGQRLWNLHPLWFDRAESFAPMIVFALSVGFGHVLIGMLLGIWSDWKIHRWREAVLKITSALLLILVGLLVVDLLHPQQWLPTAPMLVGIAALLPLLIAVGGLLAPLELLKGIGNVISYVRIMAIGLSSVLLAYVANRLGGMTGDVVLGILVAGLLHSFNLLLGVFAPTVHVLRLHYVEFFSKFLELGGRRFQPLGKKPPL